jgi:hypothetical protein
MLPTPSTKDVSGGAVEAMRTPSGFKRVSKQGVSHGAQLHDVMKSLSMLPTPRPSKMTNETEESWTRRHKAGLVSTPPLGLAINMLPTPHGNCHTGAGEHGEGGQNIQTAINTAPIVTGGIRTQVGNGKEGTARTVESGSDFLRESTTMLPTPKGRDWKGETQRGPDAPMYGIQNTLSAISGKIKVNRGTSRGLKLQPAFVEWMMGYPIGYTELTEYPANPRRKGTSPFPFRNKRIKHQRVEHTDLKPSETPLSPKSPKSSDGQ